MKHIPFSLSVFSIVFLATLSACNKYRAQVTESGLKYQIHQHEDSARKAKRGDIISFHMVILNNKDSVLRDTYKEMKPEHLPVQPLPFKGGFEEGLEMLAEGDSATFFINADTLFAKMMQPLPPMVEKGSDLTFNVKILGIQTPEEFQKAEAEAGVKQKTVDDELIRQYLAKNNLKAKATKTSSGLYYIVNKPGKGISTPKAGDKASVNFEGRLLNGKIFDSSKKNPKLAGKPFQFQVGVGSVIPGWDEALLNMKPGESRLLILPSALGYGVQGIRGAIPPNSILLFDVNLVDFANADAPPSKQPKK